MTLPILVLSPHSSGQVPLEVLAEMLGDALFSLEAREARLRWLFDEGDPYTDLIYHVPAAHNLHAPYSRFVVDLNRFREQSGANGVIKLTDFAGNPLYPAGFALSASAREQRLRRYWDSFNAEIETLLALHDIKLLINGHSMQATGPVLGDDTGKLRPAITLMTAADPSGHTLAGYSHSSLDAADTATVLTLLDQHFSSILATAAIPARIALNEPWSLDETSYRFSDPARPRAVKGFGLEFNRALYLYSDGDKEYPNEPMIKTLNSAFEAFVNDLSRVLV